MIFFLLNCVLIPFVECLYLLFQEFPTITSDLYITSICHHPLSVGYLIAETCTDSQNTLIPCTVVLSTPAVWELQHISVHFCSQEGSNPSDMP